MEVLNSSSLNFAQHGEIGAYTSLSFISCFSCQKYSRKANWTDWVLEKLKSDKGKTTPGKSGYDREGTPEFIILNVLRHTE